jgi:hypothetical protein
MSNFDFIWIKYFINDQIYFYNIKNKQITKEIPFQSYIPRENSEWIIFKDEKSNKFYYYNKYSKIKSWFPFFRKNTFSTINNLDYKSFNQENNFVIYLSNGKTYSNNISENIFNRLCNENTLIIANSISGKVGFIEYLCNVWNYSHPFNPLNIIWKNMSSFDIYNSLDDFDIAVSYEPHIESILKNKNKIKQLEHIFINQFEIISPENDIYNLRNLKNIEPENIITNLIKNVFLQDIEDNNTAIESKFNKVFIKNSEYSILSIKEDTLFSKAITNILNQGFNDDEKNKLFELHFNLGRLSFQEKHQVLYREWMNHVIQVSNLDLQENLNKVINSNEYRNCYQINDRYLIFKNNLEKRIISNTSDYSLTDSLQNYSQIWYSMNKIEEDSTQEQFYKWVIKNKEGLINYWFPEDNELQKKMQENLYQSLYYAKNDYTFNKIIKAYNIINDSKIIKKKYDVYKKLL